MGSEMICFAICRNLNCIFAYSYFMLHDIQQFCHVSTGVFIQQPDPESRATFNNIIIKHTPDSNSIADVCTSIGDIFNSVNKCENGAPYKCA